MGPIYIFPSPMRREGPSADILSLVVIAAFDDVVYKRELALDSGYEELTVYPAETTEP